MTTTTSERKAGGSRVLAVAVVVVGLMAAACGGDELADRQAEVADRGEDVMPFDLEATTHQFDPVANGLVQTVVADDPTDAEQIALVRQHLAAEAERFADGDYRDPAAIHGDDMPGLGDLEAGASRIDVTYDDQPAGGRIAYTTADAALVEALHRWAEAQTLDHDDHAESGH